MNHNILFTPYVTVEVTETGEVVGVEVDWSDTLRNDYTTDGDEVWTDGKEGDQPPTTNAACSYLDGEAVRTRVLTALQPRLPEDDPLKQAIATVQSFADEVEANQRRAILFVAWDRELTRDYPDNTPAGETEPTPQLLVDFDPYEASDAKIVGFADWDYVSSKVYEADKLKSEDYETLDNNEGEGNAYQRVLDVLQLLASGVTPEQTKEALKEA